MVLGDLFKIMNVLTCLIKPSFRVTQLPKCRKLNHSGLILETNGVRAI